MKRLLMSLLCGLAGFHALLQADPTRPKLVVGIAVDQLRTDYLDFLKSMFGEKGFKMLMEQGLYLKDVEFPGPGLDAVSGTALLYTGAYPSSTGVPGATVYDQKLKKHVPTLNDPSALGNFTNASYSPAGLLLSTISDEIAIDGGGLGAIYSIALDPQQAVIMAGHAGNSAFWIDDNTGKWSSTTYYRDTPQPMSRRNYGTDLAARLDTMAWQPLLPLDKYPALPEQQKYYPFRHTFPRSDRDAYRMFLASPLANREVTDAAIDYINTLKPGNRGADAIDMLNIGYTLQPYTYGSQSDNKLELQDSYLRLDQQLERLLTAIDHTVGLDNTLIYLSSTGYFNDTKPDDEKFRIPGGDFSTRRAASLLNAYLSAKHGNGDFVEAITDGQVYLDHSTLEARRLDADAVALDARSFLCRMSGVADAVTLQEILSVSRPGLEGLRRMTDPKRCGDIFLLLAPGWTEVDDLSYPPVTKTVRSNMVCTPALIMGPEVEAKVLTSPVDAACLAPTITQKLRIRSPNGAQQRPLVL